MPDPDASKSETHKRLVSEEEEDRSKGLEEQVENIVRSVAKGLENPTNHSKDVLTAYAEVLKAATQLESALPKKRVLSFRLTADEGWVLFIYAVGGLGLMFVAGLIPGVGWKAQDLVNVLLYWSTVVAILLGAQALPQIFGKGSSTAASTSKAGSTS